MNQNGTKGRTGSKNGTDLKRKLEPKRNRFQIRGISKSGYCAFGTMGKSELREISRRGGIASGKSRREKRKRIEEKEIEELVRIGVIKDGTRILKQIYSAMSPEERLAFYDFSVGGRIDG